MPHFPVNDNTHKSSKAANIERKPFKCQGCGHPSEHFMLEIVGDFVQLRCGDFIMGRAEIICLVCGRISYWNIKEKDIEKMAITYGQLVEVKRYNPE